MEHTHLSVQKIVHPVKMRMLRVIRKHWLTPYLLSVTLTGEELENFISLSFNDHVKLFLPEPNSKPTLPQLNANGSLDISNMQGTFIRDFTPCHYDKKNNELEIQFFIHQDRPASVWASQAKPGDSLGMIGPKKSLVFSSQFDWFLMLGDETAMPAISRRLEELPTAARIIIMLEIGYEEKPVHFKSATNLEMYWIDKNKHTLLEQLKKWSVPQGEGFIWGAGEFSSMQEIYAHLINSGIDKSRMKISSYWKKGYSDTHGTFGKDK